MSNQSIRKATPADIPAMLAMYGNSRQIMRQSGNSSQWVNGYPSAELLQSDIARGDSYIIQQDDRPVGVFAFIIGRDHTYANIYEGAWKDDERPYGTIHRIAVAPGSHGIFRTAIEWCSRQIPSLRIDTHRDNTIMLHLVPQAGFEYCGIIYIDDGTPRLAFQITDTGKLCQPLQDYIDSEILPRYDSFDPAHRRDHALKVIHNSLHLAAIHHAEPNMCLTVAAYHDLGLAHGREQHHTFSRQILLADHNLLRWFSPRQIATMADAAQDHRASSDHEPRTLYGKIVAEADRDIEPLLIIRRTVQYGLDHYPQLSYEQHWQRAQQHLNEKYGRNGYLKLWLSGSKNEKNLEELRQIIDRPDRLRPCFEKIFCELTQS